MQHTKEFSKRAKDYQDYNYLQVKIAKKLISQISNKPKRILDLGCGSGEVFKEIDWEYEKFIAVDFAKNMCKLHPKNPKIEVLNFDFDDKNLYKKLLDSNIDTVISSSSLQWSQNLELLAQNISKISDNIYLSIFTNNTFKTINKTTNLNSILPTSENLLKIFDDFEFEIENYKLYFKNNNLIFKYIKNSGVSGGVKRLDFKSTKKLIKEYPVDYLEFEVMFLKKINN